MQKSSKSKCRYKKAGRHVINYTKINTNSFFYYFGEISHENRAHFIDFDGATRDEKLVRISRHENLIHSVRV